MWSDGHTKPKQGEAFRIDRAAVMNCPVDYFEDENEHDDVDCIDGNSLSLCLEGRPQNGVDLTPPAASFSAIALPSSFLRNRQSRSHPHKFVETILTTTTMADEDEIAALVIDNGSGMCKGGYKPVQTAAKVGTARGNKSDGCWPQVGANGYKPASSSCGRHTGISGYSRTFRSTRWQLHSILQFHTFQRCASVATETGTGPMTGCGPSKMTHVLGSTELH
ncbi:hypothetical protein THAOC_19539, partial [Thalassiosira oceanica]